MAKSGEGFVRLDFLLLEHVKTAVKEAPHLLNEVITTEASLRRQGQDFRGRQAILMVRNYFRESVSDRKHTDRAKVEAVRLKGGDIEGLWDSFQVAILECAPENVPDDDDLLHHLLNQLRSSSRS